MMKKMWFPTLVVAAVTCLVVGPCLAGDFDLPGGTWWEDARLASYLELSAEQREEIRTRVYDHARRMVDLNAAVKKSEIELHDRVGRSEFDPDAIRAAFAAFQTARQRLDAERFEMLLGVREALTAEQWDKLQQAKRRIEQLRDTRREDRPPRDGPPLRPGAGQRRR
jgi:Spy/CpxP family protein refolding chaperone